MKRISFLTLCICLTCYAVFGQQSTYWQQQADVNIDVSLNDIDHSLNGYIKMKYTNNSPDTLRFIWIHVWPNAYKNDRTSFSDQQLENGSTDFYFSNNDKRGYINRLDFKMSGITCVIEDHPQHQDIIKLVLPSPLLPKSSCTIESPFHVKLPYNFSRGGYINQTYQVTQWYPKPAVYDQKGWHPMPYFDQGEFYSEFGNYTVQITLPENYTVAATGNFVNENNSTVTPIASNTITEPVKRRNKKTAKPAGIASAAQTKTLIFKQDNVHDFAWFASKTFVVKKDTLQLASGKIIDVYAYHNSISEPVWKNSIRFIKQAIQTKSKWLGEYPYNIVSVVEDEEGNGGMEYPTITYLSGMGSEKMLDYVINHEIGHNWFYGILASNERKHPWMDEGMNSYYDNKYNKELYGKEGIDFLGNQPAFLKKRLPEDISKFLVEVITQTKKDQPIETASADFSPFNYNTIAYSKAALWLELLEKKLGPALFDSAMRNYYAQWKFKHPYPEDFKKSIEESSGQNLDEVFNLLTKKGALEKNTIKKKIKLVSFFSLKETDKYNYIAIAPSIGFNFYDKFMVGGLIHSYSLPLNKFQFLLTPLYATNSKQLNGLGRLNYSFFTNEKGNKVDISLAGSSFSGNAFTDSSNTTKYLRFSKIAPAIRFTFANKNPKSLVTKFIQWKTYLFNEQGLLFEYDSVWLKEKISYPTTSRYLNQLIFNIENNRVLYPYRGIFTAEQSTAFLRLNFTGNYYFNYAKGGGLNVRFFAGKFIYLGDKTFTKQFETDPYHLNMSGAKGYEDYSYSNYFVGRSEFDRFSSQQIMIRDGGFKVRTDLLSSKIGKTDDWLSAVNFTTSIPDNINPLSVLPFKLPIKAFLDIGTYAEAWKKNAPTGRFIYDAGLQLSLFKNTINVYVPLLYSKVYSDYFKSTILEKRFIKNISFSIDIHQLNLRKLIPQMPL